MAHREAPLLQAATPDAGMQAAAVAAKLDAAPDVASRAPRDLAGASPGAEEDAGGVPRSTGVEGHWDGRPPVPSIGCESRRTIYGRTALVAGRVEGG
jgi:hypothetical protein